MRQITIIYRVVGKTCSLLTDLSMIWLVGSKPARAPSQCGANRSAAENGQRASYWAVSSKNSGIGRGVLCSTPATMYFLGVVCDVYSLEAWSHPRTRWEKKRSSSFSHGSMERSRLFRGFAVGCMYVRYVQAVLRANNFGHAFTTSAGESGTDIYAVWVCCPFPIRAHG